LTSPEMSEARGPAFSRARSSRRRRISHSRPRQHRRPRWSATGARNRTRSSSSERRSGATADRPSRQATPRPAWTPPSAGERQAAPFAEDRLEAERASAPGVAAPHHDQHRAAVRRTEGRDCLCPKAAVRAMPARLLLLCVLLRSSWLTAEGGRDRRRHSAASPGRTGSRGRVGGRGWWRSVATASGPVRRTPVFLGCKPPIRVLLVGQTSYLWSAGDTAFPPRATVLLRRQTPLVSRGRTDAVPPSAEAWEPSAFIPHHRIDRSSAQQALTLRPKAGLPQLVGIFVCRDSRFACKSRGEVAARGEIL